MTPKDYKVIEECLNKAGRQARYRTALTLLEEIVDNLAYELKRDNANFDKEKFVAAVYRGVRDVTI